MLMSRIEQDELVQNKLEDALTALREEKEALETWLRADALPDDLREGFRISLSKIETVLNT
jgi:hypothetical protein